MRRFIASEETRALRSSVGSNSSLSGRRASFGVRCSDSEFSLRQIFYSTVRGLTKFKTRRSQISTMVNLGIGFQEPLAHPGVKLDEKMSNYSSDSPGDSERSRGIYKFQLAGK